VDTGAVRKRETAALPDGGFLRQICKILEDLKVVWGAKNISGGLPISGGLLADLTNFAWVCFCHRHLVKMSILKVLESLLAKNNLILTFSSIKKLVDKKLLYAKQFKKINIYSEKYFQKNINISPLATAEIRQNPHKKTHKNYPWVKNGLKSS
jgi:hypothetical protein